jgi:hypothetical protein
MNGMFEFQTTGFNGYAVKYSPFFDSRIAVASSGTFSILVVLLPAILREDALRVETLDRSC